jgi:DnaK suppressor protein
MEKKQVRYFKTLLHKRRQDLISRLNHANEDSAPAHHDYGRDDADRANGSQTQQLVSRLSSQERVMLDAIERALHRVEDGSFGMCVACHREIGSKRLEAVPWALRCIHCQQRVEGRAA